MESKLSRKVIIITNIPSPYRIQQFDRLSSILDGNLCIIYYRRTEANRNWTIPQLGHKSVFLTTNIFSKITFHTDIISCIAKEKPTIIIAAGFTLTVLFTFIYTKLTRKKFIVFTDSWLRPVNKMKFYHRLIRKYIIPRADASICVGKKGREFLFHYGAKQSSIFVSPLAINNSYYLSFYKPIEYKEYDIIFSGQFIYRKMPFFVIDILKGLKERKYKAKFLLIGSGPLEMELMAQLKNYNIDYSYPGFIQQEDLPRYYANAKLLLFPTDDDPWGIVTNEANAVGIPVITCENAGAANDLVIHNYNGYVLPLSVDIWVDHVLKLLSDRKIYDTFSKNSLEHIKGYSIENAANGINNAINYLQSNGKN
jgi:glycosyltransferase involved in cell wall biosynthesis